MRIRPPRVMKDKVPLMSITPIGGNQGIEVRKWKNNGQRSESGKGFRFDRVFPPETSQDDIFSSVRYMSERLIKGFNGAVIAYVYTRTFSLTSLTSFIVNIIKRYGQTGSGKTHTIGGMQRRMIRRVCELVQKERKEKSCTMKLHMACVEVYNDKVRDLLGDSRFVDIKSSSSGDNDNSDWSLSVRFPNLVWTELNRFEDSVMSLTKARTARAVGRTSVRFPHLFFFFLSSRTTTTICRYMTTRLDHMRFTCIVFTSKIK